MDDKGLNACCSGAMFGGQRRGGVTKPVAWGDFNHACRAIFRGHEWAGKGKRDATTLFNRQNKKSSCSCNRNWQRDRRTL